MAKLAKEEKADLMAKKVRDRDFKSPERSGGKKRMNSEREDYEE